VGGGFFDPTRPNMLDSIVTYHIHRQSPLPTSDALAYQYVLAAGGLYLRAENRFFDVLLPIARFPIRGLASLQPHFRPKVPRLPGRLLAAVLSNARRARGRDGRLKEALYHFHHDGARVRVLKPPQRATTAGVLAIESEPAGVLLDLHSHGNLRAFWSGTDDGDEQGFHVYGVIGRLDERPEIRLRLGVYGYWFPMPVSLLFDGMGGFVDIVGQKTTKGAGDAVS
jgi:PRTRC genetic system protein A